MDDASLGSPSYSSGPGQKQCSLQCRLGITVKPSWPSCWACITSFLHPSPWFARLPVGQIIPSAHSSLCHWCWVLSFARPVLGASHPLQGSGGRKAAGCSKHPSSSNWAWATLFYWPQSWPWLCLSSWPLWPARTLLASILPWPSSSRPLALPWSPSLWLGCTRAWFSSPSISPHPGLSSGELDPSSSSPASHSSWWWDRPLIFWFCAPSTTNTYLILELVVIAILSRIHNRIGY